jgi:hypothetical protein
LAEIVYRSGVKSGVIAFKAKSSITRPANTTQYAIGDLINANGATTLITFDFGTEYANQVIEINKFTIISDNVSATTKLSAGVYFFNASTINGAGDISQKDDNTAFAPTVAQVDSKLEGMFEDLLTSFLIGTTSYGLMVTEKQETIKLDASGKIYIAVTANNTYTPASGEILRLVFKGYILG